MGAVAFNGEGLLCSLLCCGLSVGIVMGGNWMGWIPYRDEPPWFFMVWAQTAAIAALLWDRSEKRLFLSAYWSHFEQVAESALNRQEARAKFRFIHPGRRVLFCGVPLALYPVAMLLVPAVMIGFDMARNPDWTLAMHPMTRRLLWFLAGASLFTQIFAFVTWKRRLLAPLPRAVVSSSAAPAVVRPTAENLFNIVDDEPVE